MGKEYRHVECPGCSAKLRISISEKHYEKTVKITCPKCHAICRTTIPKPTAAPKRSPADFLKDIFGDSSDLDDLFGKIPKK